MNKYVIKSNSALVAIGNSPAWTTGEDSGRLMSLIQGCDFSIDIEKQKEKSLGRQSFCVYDLIKAPEVSCSMSYILSPHLNNELLLGFGGESGSYSYAFSGFLNKNNNLYLILDPRENKDAFDEVSTSGGLTSGMQALSFGNCYLTRYGINFDLNSVPIASIGFSSSNIRFENITGTKISIPAINPYSGNSSGSGFLDVSKLYQTLSSGYISGDLEGKDEFHPSIALSHKSFFTLQNLQIGGTPLNSSFNPILQSFGLNLDLNRIPQYGLGNNYPYGRKLDLPILGSISINCLVSGVESGSLSNILINESGYSFEVGFSDQNKSNTGWFKVENAKLENINYSMQVNDVFLLNATFSLQVSETGGFLIKREIPSGGRYWNSVADFWQNISIQWQNM